MDKKGAVSAYQYGERAKSELIIASQLVTVLSGLKDAERTGGKRVVLQCLESIRIELQFAFRTTSDQEFQKATDHLNQTISLVESNDFDQAMKSIAAAISNSTTVAMVAWQELEKHEFV